MNSFEELVTSRKTWLNEVLKPWCQQATRKELLKAEAEWTDLAGKVEPEKTLWLWAWSRFPKLVHENLGIDESSEVNIQLSDGRKFVGFPDARKSLRGQLTIWGSENEVQSSEGELGPFAIDEIVEVNQQCTESL